MTNTNQFANPGCPVEARRMYLASIPPAPFNLKVSKLREGFALSVRNAVLRDGVHFGMDAMIVNGEMWVNPAEIHDLVGPGHDIHDPDDDCCYIPPELYVDREALAKEQAEVEVEWKKVRQRADILVLMGVN